MILLYTHSLLFATLAGNCCISLTHFVAQIESPLFDHVGGMRILKVKRGRFHTNRPDRRPFISFQPGSYGCMPLNPHLTWTCAVDGRYIGLSRVARLALLTTLFFVASKVTLYDTHSFIRLWTPCYTLSPLPAPLSSTVMWWCYDFNKLFSFCFVFFFFPFPFCFLFVLLLFPSLCNIFLSHEISSHTFFTKWYISYSMECLSGHGELCKLRLLHMNLKISRTPKMVPQWPGWPTKQNFKHKL